MELWCADPSQRWFALRVKTGHEKPVSAGVGSKGFEHFLPLHQHRRRWSDRMKSTEVPLFPGYLFCRLNVERRIALLTIPGVMHFVGMGKVPIPIPDSEVEGIQTALRAGRFAEPWPFLQVGQRVRLECGPLAGLEGLLINIRDEHRIVVSVNLLRRSLAVEIERDWVDPIATKLDKIARTPDIPAAAGAANRIAGTPQLDYQGPSRR